MTGGHAAALSQAVGRVLDRFELTLSGASPDSAAPTYVREADPGSRPDGAYHTYADFRLGRVNTSVHLSARATRTAAELGKLTFRTAYLEPGKDARARDRSVVWGYHVGGHSYLRVNKQFHELSRDREGRTLVYVEEGLSDPEVTTSQMLGGALGGALGAALATAAAANKGEERNTLFALDLQTGALSPYAMTYAPARVGGRTMLHSVVGRGGRKIEVHRPAGVQYLGPDEYLLLEPGEEVSFAVAGYRWEPVSKHLREGSADRPVLYRLSVSDSGGVTVRKAGQQAAVQFRNRLQSGKVEPAR